MKPRCANAWESMADGRARVTRCKHFALPGLSYCEGCAEQLVQHGEACELRCPGCDEFGDFSHLTHERPAAELAETIVSCGNCRAQCLVVEALLVLRVELVP